MNVTLALVNGPQASWGVANVTVFRGAVADAAVVDVPSSGCNGWSLCTTVTSSDGVLRGLFGDTIRNVSRMLSFDRPVRRLKASLRLYTDDMDDRIWVTMNARPVWWKERAAKDKCNTGGDGLPWTQFTGTLNGSPTTNNRVRCTSNTKEEDI